MSRVMNDTHKIEYVNGHWEIKDECGNFVLSGDTWDECYHDLVDMLVADEKMENIRERRCQLERI